MKLRLLFTICVVLLGSVLLYQKAPSENFGDEQATRVEEEAIQGDREVREKDLVPETKSVEPKQEVSAPGPLQAPSLPLAPRSSESEVGSAPAPASTPTSSPELVPPPSGGLTRSGVILQTNLQRQQNGLGFLAEENILDAMALSKANDMCEKQYFAHTSPSGIGAGNLADSFGYDYLSIGENLALGPFADDAAVVLAWMGSPGHRANILNPKFTEIGVGAVKCVFEGRSTWLAVQHFGRPASLCPEPNVSLRQAIDEKKIELANVKDRLVVLRAEIEAADPKDAQYNDKVGVYNSLARQYNSLIAETRSLINQYNSEVAAFNVCASS